MKRIGVVAIIFGIPIAFTRTLVILFVLLLPSAALASPATFSAARSLLSASTSPGNAYAAGVSVVVTAPVAGDLSAFGGSVVTAAPISGDALLLAGTVSSRGPVSGDLRAIAGSVNVEKSIAGDLVAFGLSVHDSGRSSGNVFIIAANTTIEDGAGGPVTIYGNNILLAGNFAGNVDIVAGGRVALASSTTIAGTLTYEAPEQAIIPASARIEGGVSYTNASYLPDPGTSRILAVISIGFFLVVRILGALIIAGLFAGLFPRLAETVVDRTLGRPRHLLLMILLGFAIFIVTPALFLLLMLTFVGIGLAFLLMVFYAFMMSLSFIYAGILLGSLLARRFARRESVLWHDGVLGMLVFSLLSLVPYVGFLIILFLTTYAAGSLLTIFFNFAFQRDESVTELP